MTPTFTVIFFLLLTLVGTVAALAVLTRSWPEVERLVLWSSLALLILASFLLVQSAEAKSFTVFTTSYNAERRQTDDTPCVGASGRNLCVAAKEGDRTIALSRDLLRHFKWHDKVKLTSDVPQCNGVFSVEDTLNRRFKMRADLFFLDRKDNTSCSATIEPFSFAQ